jgi:hypothetical protein
VPRFPDAKGSLTPSPWRRSEIFDIVSALETAEGKGTTFYSFLNTTKSADEKAIAKAYRKRSLELQRVPLSLSLSLSPSSDRTADLDSAHTARTRTRTTKRFRTASPASASSPTFSRTRRSASGQSPIPAIRLVNPLELIQEIVTLQLRLFLRQWRTEVAR